MSRNRNVLKDLNDLARIESDVDAQQRAICHAQSALHAMPVNASTTSPHFFGAKFMRPRNLIAMAATTLLIVLATQLVPTQANGNLAFGQVQQQVAAAKSVQYMLKTKTTIEGQNNEPELEMRVSILGADKMREEVTGKMGNELDGNPHLDQHYTLIVDFGREKEIILHPHEKTFLTPQRKLLPAAGKDSNVTATAASNFASAHPRPDLYAMFDVPPEATKDLPEKTIDGKKVMGFQYEKSTDGPHGKNTMKVTYWIDPATKRPVRMEKQWISPAAVAERGTDGKSAETIRRGQVNSVISDIVFDAPLDSALFSTDPPKGYTDAAAGKSDTSSPAKAK